MTAAAVSTAPAEAPAADAVPATRRRPLLTPRRSNILLVLVAVIAIPTVTERAMPLLLKPNYSLTIAEGAAIAIAALSLNLLTGYAGQVSLGHAALLGAGGFADGLVTSRAGLPMWIGEFGCGPADDATLLRAAYDEQDRNDLGGTQLGRLGRSDLVPPPRQRQAESVVVVRNGGEVRDAGQHRVHGYRGCVLQRHHVELRPLLV